MKRYLLTIACIAGSWGLLFSQNLVQNGGLESWVNPTTPENWDKAENISQSDVIVYSGVYSAEHTSADATKDLQQDVEGIIEGVNYHISYRYYDNDPEARTRIWSYWLSGGSTLAANEAELRPNVYSEDNPDWQVFDVTLTAPATADAFRFEVRVYKQDNVFGGSVYYDDFIVEQAGVDPEPSAYPANFAATPENVSIVLTWLDATGTQLPGAYLVLASSTDNIVPPVDGTPVEDDTDLSDGTGALNVFYGVETCTFAGLEGNATYHFAIFPYTNGGANINYKSDGTWPEAQATTANIAVIETENFNNSWGGWTAISVTGAQVWERDNNYGLEGTPCARMSGYEGGSNANEDWLISPAMNFSNYENELLSFHTAMNYTGPELEVLISTNYDGSGNPASGNWNSLTGTLSGGSWEWTFSGDIDVSAYNGNAVYVAFKYTSTASESATWEVDDILITGTELVGIHNPELKPTGLEIFPNPVTESFSVMTSGDLTLEKIEVYSITGKLIWTSGNDGIPTSISAQSWKPGTYLLIGTFSDGSGYSAKFLKQ